MCHISWSMEIFKTMEKRKQVGFYVLYPVWKPAFKLGNGKPDHCLKIKSTFKK